MAQPCCTTCLKSPPEVTLKHCAKCSTTPYCSRECQKADWKSHKKTCGKGNSNNTAGTHQNAFGNTPFPQADQLLSPPKGLDQPITRPFTRLDNGTWLHGRPERDVYRLLIDAYRLRVADNRTFEGVVEKDTLQRFRRFLGLAASRPGVLPEWWSADKQDECEALGMGGKEWQDLRREVDKGAIMEHYGDARFPMQLRMFAEAVYGRGVGGNDGTAMRRMMASMEQGTAGSDAVASTIDVRTGRQDAVRSAAKSQ